MSDIFGGVEPPAWLTKMTVPNEQGLLGKIIGELVGGFADSAEVAVDKAGKKQAQGINTSWIKEIPGSIQPGFFDARMNLQNPLWKMQAQQAQLNLAQQGLAMQNQQSQIDARKTKMQMQQHDQDVLPQWLQEHPTWESRQDAEPPKLFTTEGQRMFRDVQLGDAGNIKHKAIVEGIGAYSKSVAELQKIDPIAAAPFAQEIGKVPSPDIQSRLEAALANAKTKHEKDVLPRAMEIDVGGKTVAGVFTPKTGKFTPNQTDKSQAAADKLASDMTKQQRAAQLDVAKKKIELIQKALIDTPDDKGLQEQFKQAQTEFNQLTGTLKATVRPTTSFKSKEDVIGAYKSGKLSRDQAAQILNQQFGVQK